MIEILLSYVYSCFVCNLNSVHRDACVVAFGGGVVGDLAGFVAATYSK